MRIELDNTLVLQQMQASDAPELFALIDQQRQYLGQWLPFIAGLRTVADISNYIQSVVSAALEQAELVFCIRYANEVVGLIGFKDSDRQNKRTEIGYWLSERHQKKGIVTRSVEALCAFAFRQLDVNRIQIKCAVGNIPSRNIPERLGFVQEGIEREGELLSSGAFTHLAIYSMLRSEFLSRN